MKFPYGLSDFAVLIQDKCYYADRSAYVHLLENAARHLLLLRPRRFGKSLLLSMLDNYYDVAKADQFEALFGHLAIGKNPTENHNKYFILRFDFSMVQSYGSLAEIEAAFHRHINVCIEAFVFRYQDRLKYPIQNPLNDGVHGLHSVANVVNASQQKLYLLIDEYDNFANELMRAKQSDYASLVHGEGVLKTLFKTIKGLSSGQGIERVFITGVSPVVMSDISSGYNVAEDLSLNADFAEICGFTASEINLCLQDIAKHCDLDPQKVNEALEMMRSFYNGYQFGYQPHEAIYNPTLALYFLKYLQRNCNYPSKILDSNLAMDRKQIQYIAQLPHGKEIIAQALDPSNPPIIAELADRFGVEDMLLANKDQPFMASLLYYLGVLTLGQRDATGDYVLKIPNLVIKRLYVERIQEQLLPEYQDKETIRKAAKVFYQTGNLRPICDFIETRYFEVFDNRDYRWSNELVIKTAFLTLLFSDTHYIMDSEQVIGSGYSDLSMIVRPGMRQFELLDHLLEFKYLSLKALDLTAEQVKCLSLEELRQLPLVATAVQQAQQQLSVYRAGLERRYQGQLRLRTHAVVALGFERLVLMD